MRAAAELAKSRALNSGRTDEEALVEAAAAAAKVIDDEPSMFQSENAESDHDSLLDDCTDEESLSCKLVDDAIHGDNKDTGDGDDSSSENESCLERSTDTINEGDVENSPTCSESDHFCQNKFEADCTGNAVAGTEEVESIAETKVKLEQCDVRAESTSNFDNADTESCLYGDSTTVSNQNVLQTSLTPCSHDANNPDTPLFQRDTVDDKRCHDSLAFWHESPVKVSAQEELQSLSTFTKEGPL
eukprot:CAMPEP_0181135378 /NCGR_PEP_ID=MMETSP1071-20121207/32593_1 /TAXON_ID=35127 /ORGANISM="Thalassiosira sp., Strain NH16" /LENGTH=243 /DNA_ID=CAMNT_0023221967 /DNA_START=72 /DNA_END=800 /DNA_ORIENTATION=+